MGNTVVVFNSVDEKQAHFDGVFSRIQSYGLEKCAFLLPCITYLEAITDKNGFK